ncbi:hypothetical protein PVAP13_2NG602900 [Panicum virgatum]|uniref:DEAD-box ATP-dependent RNA helicase 36 n=1 Tax=Panicum virgatum TaxID=38727 RepID=A0A8T0VY16_PANVG|nr:hypothetical protein PVAP13_2NG602900 [Panicum virgatum]
MEVEGEAQPFRLFSGRAKRKPKLKPRSTDPAAVETDHADADPVPTIVTETGQADDAEAAAGAAAATFADLGLSQWLVDTCSALGMKRPTAVQRRCIPRALAGEDVLGIAETGSGKTAAFALPILHRLGEDPYGVAALALVPTRELAAQLAEQFRALGAPLGVRCLAAIGGFESLAQAKGLARRPHIVVATPGRIATLVKYDPDLAKVFARTKFLVLDEADRVLDVNFEEELRVIFGCLPKKRQTFLFSATMSDNLRSLLELSGNKSYFFEAYEGFKTVETLKQQYIHVPDDGKELHLTYLLSKIKDKEDPIQKMGDPIRSVIVFVSRCRNPRDYIHRVGRTARASRGGLAISFVTQKDICLLHEIEDIVGKQLEAYECSDKEVTKNITKVFKAQRLAKMKMDDEGHEEKVHARKEQKKRDLARKRKHES